VGDLTIIFIMAHTFGILAELAVLSGDQFVENFRRFAGRMKRAFNASS